jgi:hypothetical protein
MYEWDYHVNTKASSIQGEAVLIISIFTTYYISTEYKVM